MNSIIRTVWGAQLQTSQLLGIPMPSLLNTTLNEALSCNTTVTVLPTDKPIVKYIAIGNGGHSMQPGVGGMALPKPIMHRSTDVTLFNHLPFVLRLPTNDLTTLEAANYRMRMVVNVLGNVVQPGPAANGSSAVTYIAYYLKVLDTSVVTNKMMYNAVANGVTTTSAYVPPVSGLVPVPVVIPNNGVNVTSGDYLTVSAQVPFIMSAADAAEFLNVCTIIYNDPNYAIISEVAVCSGVDKAVTNNIVGVSLTPLTYNDLVSCQIVSFISTFFAMQFNNTGIDFTIDIGATEPLWLA